MSSLRSILLAALSCTTLITAAVLPQPSLQSRATTGNPFLGKQMYANPHYSNEVLTSAVPNLSASLAAKAKKIANTPTFFWLDETAKVTNMANQLNNIKALNAAGASPPVMGTFIVYNLPNRDCAADASNGELSVDDGGVAKYKTFIDDIVTQVKKHPKITIALIIEPDSLGNLVTNLDVAKCSAAQSAYMECFKYALTNLNLPNVAMYLDAGHAGWLGWSANLQPAATLFAKVYKSANSPAAVRGLATNVANYNAFKIATCPSYTSGDSNCDESDYVTALAPLLTTAGYPAHFIMDTGRNGVQPDGRSAWGDWCNVKGAGFGIRPTTDTGSDLEDAFIWGKPGGESDGTSNSSAARYDPHCGLSDALQSAPQAGTWFEAYFEDLLQNANPAIET